MSHCGHGCLKLSVGLEGELLGTISKQSSSRSCSEAAARAATVLRRSEAVLEVIVVEGEVEALVILIKEILGGVSGTLSGLMEDLEILLIVRQELERSTLVLIEARGSSSSLTSMMSS